MRMWMINPKHLCRKHLLGEHVECHMVIGSYTKRGIEGLKGFDEFIELHNVLSRHNALAKEMLNRGYNHNSDMIVVLLNGEIKCISLQNG